MRIAKRISKEQQELVDIYEGAKGIKKSREIRLIEFLFKRYGERIGQTSLRGNLIRNMESLKDGILMEKTKFLTWEKVFEEEHDVDREIEASLKKSLNFDRRTAKGRMDMRKFNKVKKHQKQFLKELDQNVKYGDRLEKLLGKLVKEHKIQKENFIELNKLFSVLIDKPNYFNDAYKLIKTDIGKLKKNFFRSMREAIENLKSSIEREEELLKELEENVYVKRKILAAIGQDLWVE